VELTLLAREFLVTAGRSQEWFEKKSQLKGEIEQLDFRRRQIGLPVAAEYPPHLPSGPAWRRAGGGAVPLT